MRLYFGLFAALTPLVAQVYRSGDPMEKWPAPRHTTSVEPRRINEYYDFFQNLMFQPGELARKSSVPVPARGVNTLGEVPDSEWYTNRHYRARMSADELMRGPGNSGAPSMTGSWRVVSAKNEGITPGFTIADAEGRRYVLKFDPPSNPEMASAADVITSKFLHALGYNVPENYIVRFRKDRLSIDANTKFTDHYGKRRVMTERDLAAVLTKVAVGPSGEIRGVASRFVPGAPVGPFRYNGTRSDDPNDTVPHEHRRELRGLRVFAAWLGHDDSKSLNTLDTLVEENGVKYVKHYLIDFGASLGSASYGPNSPRSGSDYLFQWRPAARQFMTFGFAVPEWARAKYPDLPAVGAFEHTVFDPERWVPEYPNSAFSNMDDADAFWAARQVMAFTDDEIRAIVSTGEYGDARAEDWVVRCLIERRNKIGRAFFARVLPLDRFAVRNGELMFEDLSSTYFGAEQSYRVQWFILDNATGARMKIDGAKAFAVPDVDARYRLAQIRSERPGQAVEVVVRGGNVVVGRTTSYEEAITALKRR